MPVLVLTACLFNNYLLFSIAWLLRLLRPGLVWGDGLRDFSEATVHAAAMDEYPAKSTSSMFKAFESIANATDCTPPPMKPKVLTVKICFSFSFF